ncbi:hypothetical protein WJX84_001272 [Apatococcus fuscideae]|uniref:Uncharacterized protein n=1 Tax=Apatococcus fuscideae TaxID=2026836 RepID=A0AAW1SN74_9CHLO
MNSGSGSPEVPGTKAARDYQHDREATMRQVQVMKKDLQVWRARLNSKVGKVREEMDSLRDSMTTQVQGLRQELDDLQASVRLQLERTKSLPHLRAQQGPLHASRDMAIPSPNLMIASASQASPSH